jgi:hypothetical protein
MIRMVLLVLLGCTSKGEDSAEDTVVSSIPDVAGRYNTQIAAATGCEGEAHWLENWVPGPLTISDSDGTLSFDFGGGMVFSGTVDANKNFSFAGEASFETEEDFDTGMTTLSARLEVTGVGSFSKRDGCWELDGDLTVLVDENDDGLEFNDCTLVGPVKSTQIDGGTCNGLL